MKCVCKYSTGIGLGKNWYSHGPCEDSVYPLSIGKEYVIYGISIWSGLTQYILIHDYQWAGLMPADLFDLIDPLIPSAWSMKYFGDRSPLGLNLIIGNEAIISEEFYDSLVDGRGWASNIVLDMKNKEDCRDL